METMKKMGLDPPPSIISRADSSLTSLVALPELLRDATILST